MESLTGTCKTCSIETEDINYVFCSIECQRLHYEIFENSISRTNEQLLELAKDNMDIYEIDKDLYKKWLEEKTPTILSMIHKEEINERIAAIIKIQFFANEELRLLAQQYGKVTGNKGIPEYLRLERNKLISNPNVKVDWDAEPRPTKKKKDKVNYKELMSADMEELDEYIKNKKKEKNGEKPKEDKEAPMPNAIDFLLSRMGKKDSPKKEEPVPKKEEKKEKEGEEDWWS